MVGTALLNDERGVIVPAIVSEHRGNAEQINMDILSRWIQGKGIDDHSWRGLLGVLRVHCSGLAKDIEETLRAETDTSSTANPEAGVPSHTPPTIQSTLFCFSDELRARYAKYPLPHHSNPQCRKWMPHMGKEYIHPDIICKEEQEEQPDSHKEAVLRGEQWKITKKGSSNSIQLEEVLQGKSGKKCMCILVEGGPGMGKSTLAWQVCHRWGRRELYDQYSTVLLLPLRDKRVQQAKQVNDILFYHMRDKMAQEEVKRDFGNSSDTLIILDGLDELPDHLLSEQSIFTDLLSGEVLSNATILVTSRPSATQQLLTCWQQRISKHFVICGFTEKHVDKYIKSVLSGDRRIDFQRYLHIHPYIQSVMYVPLYSAIAMAVYLQCKQLPKTITELYTWLVRIILTQYLTDHSNDYSGEEKICVLGLRLPKTIYTYFIELSNFAFQSVSDHQLILSDVPEELHNLGFTDSVPELFLPVSNSYNFLHLSIQEFLAAYHVSLLSLQEQEHLLLRSREELHFKNMMIFAAGITKFEGIKKEVVKQVVEVEEKGVCYLDTYSLELLYECQIVSILDYLDNEGTYSVRLMLHAGNHQYFALGYCITNSKCSWELGLYGNQNPDMCNVSLDMFLQGLNDSKVPSVYGIKSVHCYGGVPEFSERLFSPNMPKYFTQRIESLSIIGMYLNGRPFCNYTALISQLHTLSLVGIFGMESKTYQRELTSALYEALCLRHLSLHKLDLKGIGFLCRWLQTCRLETLSLPYLQPDEIVKVTLALTAVPSLKMLNMEGSFFDIYSMQVLTHNLQQNPSIETLKISYCFRIGVNAYQSLEFISPEVGQQLLDIISKQKWVSMVGLGFNTEHKGTALAMSNRSTVLSVLDLNWKSVDVAVLLAMANKLKDNTTLRVLDMSIFSMGEVGALVMAEMLKHNMTLRELDMSNNSVLAGTINMGEIVTPGNPIGEEGAKALVESLAVNHHLKTLRVSMEYKKLLEGFPPYQAYKDRVQFS